jgi:hypothetical protein
MITKYQSSKNVLHCHCHCVQRQNHVTILAVLYIVGSGSDIYISYCVACNGFAMILRSNILLKLRGSGNELNYILFQFVPLREQGSS